jgi:U3 small nucleolar ribonucleoprotein protein IMP3
MRQLKHHEQKLLKKVNFFQYKKEDNVREIKVLRRYHIQDRDDYVRYNKMCGHVTELVTKLKALDARDPFRIQLTQQLLGKLYAIGVCPTKKGLSVCDKLSASSFCRRRLPVVLVRNKYAETLREAVTFVEQGHIRVGPEVVTDPAFIVTRSLEDFITWTDSSKIKRQVRSQLVTRSPSQISHTRYATYVNCPTLTLNRNQVKKYNDTLDDYDLLDL